MRWSGNSVSTSLGTPITPVRTDPVTHGQAHHLKSLLLDMISASQLPLRRNAHLTIAVPCWLALYIAWAVQTPDLTYLRGQLAALDDRQRPLRCNTVYGRGAVRLKVVRRLDSLSLSIPANGKCLQSSRRLPFTRDPGGRDDDDDDDPSRSGNSEACTV